MPKRRIGKVKTPPRYSPTQIKGVIAAAKAPVTWPLLIDALDAQTPAAITQMRQVLKALQRSGEILKDPSGAFVLASASTSPDATFTVTRQGKRLFAEDWPIEDPPRTVREGDEVTISVFGDGADREARINTVVSLSSRPVFGILRSQAGYAYVEAMGDFRGRVSLVERPSQGNDGDTVEVRIVEVDRHGLAGVVVDVVESEGVLDQAIETAVAAGNIPFEWPSEVERAVEKLPKRVNRANFKARVDLTQCPLVTIDGETAKDFDDAVFAERLPGRAKGWRLLVAIADVGHYVKTSSALDKEAVERGTSVYFPQRVIPMLPEEISNGLCSLRPLEDRLSLVCEMRINANGTVADHNFFEAVIYSHARLTYNEVQAFLDKGEQLPTDAKYAKQVDESVTTLQQLFVAMRGAREKRGALDFETQEGLIHLNKGVVASIEPVNRLDAHMLIEEAMIAANVCAAMFIEKHDRSALYRVHEPPDADKLEELRQVLLFAGVKLAPGSIEPKAMQAALQRLPPHINPALFAQFALRSLQQAVYTPDNKGHFGLALERYMHFTSPIRRYPDLIVHRTIKNILAQQANKKATFYSGDALHHLGQTCSGYERRAESAGWMVEGWLKCEFLKREVGNTLKGYIGGVTEFGLFVELEGYFIQGLVHISNLGSDYYNYNPRALALEGERSGRKFVLGDKLKVIVGDIDAPKGKIDLQLADGSGGSDKKSSRGKTSSKQGNRSKSASGSNAGKTGKKSGNKSGKKAGKKNAQSDQSKAGSESKSKSTRQPNKNKKPKPSSSDKQNKKAVKKPTEASGGRKPSKRKKSPK